MIHKQTQSELEGESGNQSGHFMLFFSGTPSIIEISVQEEVSIDSVNN